MIIVKLQGGLGNQMFEYASGRGIAKKAEQDFALDLSGLDTPQGVTKREYQLDVFNIQPKFASKKQVWKFTLGKHFSVTGKLLKKIGINIPSYIAEKGVDFNDALFSIKGSAYLDGYWQSEKYFKHNNAELQEAFTLKKPASEPARKIIELTERENSVAIQVRRGDYVTNRKAAALHGVLDIEYYQRAIAYICTKVPNPTFFAISDDPEWVTTNLKTPSKIIPVPLADYEQMWVMRSCKHQIISNSSFGWWGAWLNTDPDKIVVAPQKWFAGLDFKIADRLPAEWVKI